MAASNGRVVVEVADDGVGGADPERGTGLRGPARPGARARRALSVESEAGRGHDRRAQHPVRVVVADDSVLLREGVVRLLEEAGFEVVGQAGDADDLLRKVARTSPTWRWWTSGCRPTTPTRACGRRWRSAAAQPETGVLVLSQYVEEGYALDLLGDGDGGVGYLLKDRVADIERFADSVRRVGDGGSALDPEVVARLLGRTPARGPAGRSSPRASARCSS